MAEPTKESWIASRRPSRSESTPIPSAPTACAPLYAVISRPSSVAEMPKARA